MLAILVNMNLTADEMNEIEQKAYIYWKVTHERDLHEIDMDSEPYLNAKLKAWVPRGDSLLRTIRKALMLTSQFVASNADISIAALTRMEKRESWGNVTLKTMHKIAEAMDCELIVGIRHKSHQALSKVVWDRLVDEAKQSPSFTGVPMINPRQFNHIKALRLAKVVYEKSKTQAVIESLGINRQKLKI